MRARLSPQSKIQNLKSKIGRASYLCLYLRCAVLSSRFNMFFYPLMPDPSELSRKLFCAVKYSATVGRITMVDAHMSR